jgi:hypothetical protein
VTPKFVSSVGHSAILLSKGISPVCAGAEGIRVCDSQIVARASRGYFRAILGLVCVLGNPPGGKDLRKVYLFGPRSFKLSRYVPDSDLQEFTGHTLFRVR